MTLLRIFIHQLEVDENHLMKRIETIAASDKFWSMVREEFRYKIANICERPNNETPASDAQTFREYILYVLSMLRNCGNTSLDNFKVKMLIICDLALALFPACIEEPTEMAMLSRVNDRFRITIQGICELLNDPKTSASDAQTFHLYILYVQLMLQECGNTLSDDVKAKMLGTLLPVNSLCVARSQFLPSEI